MVFWGALLSTIICITGTTLGSIPDDFNAAECMKQAHDVADEYFSQQAEIAQTVPNTQDHVSSFLGSSNNAKQLGIIAFQQLQCLKIIQDSYKLSKDEMQSAMENMDPLLESNDMAVTPDTKQMNPKMGGCPYPKNNNNNKCIRHANYRTYDGSCNNLNKPLWGRSMRPLARYIYPDYFDGIGAPRRAKSGNELPSTRHISLSIFEDIDKPSSVHTLMFMTYGQFLAHDMMRTAVTKFSTDPSGEGELVNVKCGDSGCETEGPENEPCMPIWVDNNDKDFPNKQCLKFVRSQEVPPGDCSPGPREQLNQITSYLDTSMVYGSDKDEALQLRELSADRGKLRSLAHPFVPHYKDLLPKDDAATNCKNADDTIKCFKAGDLRANENSPLAAMQTVFQRGHNSIEEELHRINPNWNGEKLYQESRRILGAAWQFITYNEYLPLVLGNTKMTQHRLNLLSHGYFQDYDDTINVENANGFGTAAFRFGHSQIAGNSYFTSRRWTPFHTRLLSTELFNPLHVYKSPIPDQPGVDSIIFGQVLQPAEGVDRFFTKQVSAKLFSPDPPHVPGTDLPARNIQRGRDHGIPGYNAWRQYCGLTVASTFNQMVDIPQKIRNKLAREYEHVDDVDLYVAGLSENHVPGGVVGPTFACIIGRQFMATRFGDRFWHELNDPYTGFTPEQLQEIRKFTLARIYCDNLDGVDTIQKYVLLQPWDNTDMNSISDLGLERFYEDGNERVPCNSIPIPNLAHWRSPSK